MSDKRKVSTDALETLGTLIGPNEKRDAIHLAVEPVQAGEELSPGQHITIVDGVAYAARRGSSLGIVDPFLTQPVEPSDRFWFVMYPRMVHTLRHVWTHPAFPNELGERVPTSEDRKRSEEWLRNFCDNTGSPEYETLIAAASDEPPPDADGYDAKRWEKFDDYLHFTGTDAYGEIPPELWDHVETVTGKVIENRPEHFSCSC